MTHKIETTPGWHSSIDRIAAERLLHKKPIGSYVLRNGDSETKDVAKQLSSSNHTPIQPYLCTVVESENRICDVLLLHSPRGWTHYRDNPDLSDSEYRYFSTVAQLLSHTPARHPV